MSAHQNVIVHDGLGRETQWFIAPVKPHKPTGFVLSSDDPAVGKNCAVCGAAFALGQRLAASGWRHLTCGAA